MQLTGIDRCHDCLHNDDRESIEATQLSDDLLHGRKLSHHIQEHGHQSAEAEKDGSRYTISLPCPLSENKTFWTFASDDWAHDGEHHERCRCAEGIDDHTLNTSDGGQLWVCEENTRAESCLSEV